MRGWILLAALLLPSRGLMGQERAPGDLGIDHLILATPNLQRGSEEFARLTGVTPRFGGQHPGRGSQNALVSLGANRYLELLAPVSPTSDSGSLVPAGWAIHTSDLPGLLQRLKDAGFSVAGPLPGSRMTPDSTLLRWRTASLSGAGLELAPFFIEWAAGTPHPSTTAPSGCKLISFELVVPDTTQLHALFLALGHEARLKTGAAERRLVLECPSGRQEFVAAPPR